MGSACAIVPALPLSSQSLIFAVATGRESRPARLSETTVYSNPGGSMANDDQLMGRIIETLQRRQPTAAFVSEVTSVMHPPPSPNDVDDALGALQSQARVLVADHAAPDVHLE